MKKSYRVIQSSVEEKTDGVMINPRVGREKNKPLLSVGPLQLSPTVQRKYQPPPPHLPSPTLRLLWGFSKMQRDNFNKQSMCGKFKPSQVKNRQSLNFLQSLFCIWLMAYILRGHACWSLRDALESCHLSSSP